MSATGVCVCVCVCVCACLKALTHFHHFHHKSSKFLELMTDNSCERILIRFSLLSLEFQKRLQKQKARQSMPDSPFPHRELGRDYESVCQHHPQWVCIREWGLCWRVTRGLGERGVHSLCLKPSEIEASTSPSQYLAYISWGSEVYRDWCLNFHLTMSKSKMLADWLSRAVWRRSCQQGKDECIVLWSSIPRWKLSWSNLQRILSTRGSQREKGTRRLNFKWDEPLEGQGLVGERSHRQPTRGGSLLQSQQQQSHNKAHEGDIREKEPSVRPPRP